MVQTARLAIVLIAAFLSGCGGLSVFDSGVTASLEDPGKSARPPTPPNELPVAHAAVQAKLDAHTAPRTLPRAVAQAAEPRGRAYLFRGIAGLIYSRGMDELAQRINRTGVQAGVDTYLMWRGVANQAIRDYRRDPQPITLIGHSMGGDAAVAFADYLNAADIPVSLLVTYDPSRFAGDVPPNVQRYINIYQSFNVMGGGNIISARGFHGHYASINLSAHGEIIHINIEKADDIQEQLVAKIVQIARTPAAGQGEAVPIRYAVPAASAIELWDSGVAVTAQAGDTLQSLATAHHVPIWALTQINAVSEEATLASGERIVIPRYLAPKPVAYSPVFKLSLGRP